ncbi:hypothetical protein AV926_14010 [Myroides marinus]|uniref:HTH araC/xylS-type domain-containing protein n=1 Tax=Myroides marinus TaxID=703342 RepID=A0A163XC30_9FLAO|nr:AraC family transcriptional regulator [Myroides marinus]KZE77663.1 hypothetical protein AV926_14010 [Myroides marinus]
MMKKTISYLVGVFFLFSIFIQAQNKETEILLAKVLTDIRPVDKNRAFYITDSIYQNDADVHIKIHALFINAYLYHDDFDIPNSLGKALQAIELAEKNKSYKWLSRLYGFVGAEYSRLELFSEAILYFNKIEDVLPKINDEYDRVFSTYYYYHLLSSYYYKKKDYKKALESIALSEKDLDKISSMLLHSADYLGANEQNKAINYLELKEYDKAKEAYEKGYSYIKNSNQFESSLTTAYIYIGLARIAFQQNKGLSSEEILDYYLKGLNIATINNNRELKEEIYCYLSDYYEHNGDLRNYSKYNKAYLQEKEAKEEFRATTVNELLEKQYIQKERIDIKNKKYFTVIVSFLVVLILFPIGFYIWRERSRKNLLVNAKINPSNLLFQLIHEEKDKLLGLFVGVLWIDEEEANQNESIIIERLKQFEKSKGYLDNSVSIESLALMCQTTSTVVINVIKKYKKIDFKTYLLHFRLLEVILLLRFEERFRTYKIGHLAEVSGFSSHSSFTIDFKKTIGVNPSFFIQYLNEMKIKV